MINHGRTLLLNTSGANRPSSTFYLEEYVPRSYLPVQLPAYLTAIRNVLMGDGADDAFENFRLWQYMKLIHATEFASYLTALDSRITYVNDRSSVFSKDEIVYEPATPEAIGVELDFIGKPTFNVAYPRLVNKWLIAVSAGLLVNTTKVNSRETSETAVTIDEGLTSPISMAGEKQFYARIHADPLPVGASWLANVFTQPDHDVTNLIPTLETLGDSLLNLFSSEEPFATFKELWDKHFQVHYRLAGLILAWIYRAEEVRVHG